MKQINDTDLLAASNLLAAMIKHEPRAANPNTFPQTLAQLYQGIQQARQLIQHPQPANL